MGHLSFFFFFFLWFVSARNECVCVFSKRSVRAGWKFLFGSRERPGVRELTSDDISSSQPAQTVPIHTSIFIPVLHRNHVALAPLVLVCPASVVLVVVDDAPASVQPGHVPPSVRTHAGPSRGSTHARSYARWVSAAAQRARVRIPPSSHLVVVCCPGWGRMSGLGLPPSLHFPRAWMGFRLPLLPRSSGG